MLGGQGLRHGTVAAGEVENAREVSTHVGQPVAKARCDFGVKKTVRLPISGSPLAVYSHGPTVEDRREFRHAEQYGREWALVKALGGSSQERVDAMLAGTKAAGRFALDLLLPPRCLSCGTLVAEPSSICADCWSDLSFITEPFCALCGYPFEYTVGEGAICGRCEVEPPQFDRARAALRYDEGSKALLLRFKHADKSELAPILGRLMLRAGQDLLRSADMVAPVPLHRWRLLRRRYNQAALLAKFLATASAVPFTPQLLTRRRNTPSQGRLERTARRRNVASAFSLASNYRDALSGKRVVLVDDVMTSGATADACSKVLKRAGASEVALLTTARVVLS